MCAEHGQCIHPWYRLGIPCIECEMAKCSRERGTWNWPFYLPHLDLHSVPPCMLLSLDFVDDSPFSVYSPALPSNLLTPGNTCVSGPQHDKKPTCRRTFSARAQRSPAASWRLSARWPLLHHRRSPMASQFDPASTHQVFLRSYLSNYIRQQTACYDASFF